MGTTIIRVPPIQLQCLERALRDGLLTMTTVAVPKLLNYKKDDDNSYTRALRAFHLSFSAPTE